MSRTHLGRIGSAPSGHARGRVLACAMTLPAAIAPACNMIPMTRLAFIGRLFVESAARFLIASRTSGRGINRGFMASRAKTGVGGPWITIAGKSIPERREIIVDQVFSRKTGLGIGDQIEMFDDVFTIVGITDKNNMMVFTRAFIDVSEAQDILGEKDSVNFILVKLPNPSQASAIAEKLEKETSGISAFTSDEFAASNAKMINDSFLPIILVITIISFLTGAVVVGLTVYTATMEKMSEFGVLKAIGATDKKLYFIVFCLFICFFFFKQKTAYEIKECDWSSDVCSSDLFFLFFDCFFQFLPFFLSLTV